MAELGCFDVIGDMDTIFPVIFSYVHINRPCCSELHHSSNFAHTIVDFRMKYKLYNMHVISYQNLAEENS